MDPFIILINPSNENSRIVSFVAPSGRKCEIRISVGRDLKHPGKLEPTTIHFCAGVMSPADADMFAEGIKVATGVARRLDELNGATT